MGKIFFIALLFLAVIPNIAYGVVTVTVATGGTNISADLAANAAVPGSTTLGTIVIAEGDKQDFHNGTFILNAPGGWNFQQSGVSVTGDATAIVSYTATSITLTLSNLSNGSEETFNIVGVTVIATDGAVIPNSGSITYGGGTAQQAGGGLVSGSTNLGSLSQVVGAASKLAFTTQPGGGTGGTAWTTQPVITLQDQFSTTVLGTAQNVTLAIQNNAGPGGVLSGTTTIAVNTGTGMATFSGLSIDKSGTGYTLTATGNTVSTSPGTIVSSAFNITAGTATKLVITGSGTQTAGTTQSITITATDDGGNTDLSYTGDKSLTFSGANSSSNPVTAPTIKDKTGTAINFGTATTITFTNGVATVSGGNNGVLALYKSENATISATDGTISSTGSDRLSVTVSVGTANKLAFSTQTSGGTSGSAWLTQPVVALQDAYGNTVTGTSQNVTLAIQNNAGPGGVLSGTTTVAVNTGTGLATFSGLSIDKIGTGYTLTAIGNTVSTSPGVIVSSAFNITASGIATKYIVTSSSYSPAAGSGVTITAQLADAGNYGVSTAGLVVAWSKSDSNGSFASSTSTTNSSGIATVVFTTHTVSGTATTITATDGGGLTGMSSSITTIPGTATKILVETAANGSGSVVSAQSLACTSSATGYAITRDVNNNFVANAAATWALINKTGSVVDGDLVPSGDSKSAVFTAHLLGTGQMEATSGSLTKTSSGTLTATIGTANASQSALTPTSASITTNGATQDLTIQAKDACGNNLSTGGSTVTITILSGIGTIGSVTDNSDGTYTATVTSPASAGSGVFVATLGGTDVQNGTGSQAQTTITYTAGTIYYLTSAGAGSAQTPGNWNTVAGGGGTAATNFTTGGDIFNIPVGINGTFGANCTFGGTGNNNGVQLQVNGTATINNGITVTLAGKGGKQVSTMIVNGTIIFAGTASNVNLSINDVDQTFTLSSGATLITANATGVTGTNCSITKAANSVVTLNTGANFEFNGTAQSMTGLSATVNNLTLSGSGTKTLPAATTVSGTLTVKAGATLSLSTFALNSPASTVLECGATSGSSIIGTGTLTFGGNLTVNNIATGTSGATISCPVALGATRTFIVADDGSTATDLTISSVISGATYGITKQGPGILYLSAANTFTGAATINNGILSVNTLQNAGNNSSLGTGGGTPAISIAGSGTLQYTGSGHSTNRVVNLTGNGATIDASGSGTLTLSGGITGNTNNLVLTGTGAGVESGVIATTTGTVTKAGTGTWTLSGANSYNGSTIISSGILALGGADRIANTSNFVLSGGTFSTGATSGNNETVGTLNLAANANIALGTGSHTLTFAASSGESWTGSTMLTITGWTGTFGSSGTSGKVFVGNSNAGLHTGQLAQVQFYDGVSTYTPATILVTGELVPFIRQFNLEVSDASTNIDPHCPDLDAPFDPDNSNYDPGVSEIAFKVERLLSTNNNWSFNYTLSGTNVSINNYSITGSGGAQPAFSGTGQNGSITDAKDNSYIIITYGIVNIPGAELNVTFTISNANDGTGGETETIIPDDNSETHVINAMPEVGSFN